MFNPTLTEAIHKNQLPDETMTQCVKRLAKAPETLTETEHRMVKDILNPPLAKPSKPATLTKGAVTEDSIEANWTAPSSGGPVDHYAVDITPAISGYPRNVSGLTHTFSGLTAATAYTIKVKAVNTSGSSTNKTLSVTTSAAAATTGGGSN